MRKSKLNQLNEERRWLGTYCRWSSMHRQIKPPKVDLQDIKERDKASRKPSVLAIYI